MTVTCSGTGFYDQDDNDGVCMCVCICLCMSAFVCVHQYVYLWMKYVSTPVRSQSLASFTKKINIFVVCTYIRLRAIIMPRTWMRHVMHDALASTSRRSEQRGRRRMEVVPGTARPGPRDMVWQPRMPLASLR